MNSYEQIAENRRVNHLRLAQVALQQYFLEGARLTLISDAENIIFKVSVPSEGKAICHPYLGRINGDQFLLRIEDVAESRMATTYSELALLATLLRDTDLLLPEPVPACNGELVPELWVGSQDARKQCVLFRWAGLPFPEAALSRAAQWREN
jgi:Ser/Thr protein kinase RdoA (MazF antagonist)